MIKVTGTLVVRTIYGRNGAFNVGKLTSEIGEFEVKDAELDQYEEGRYEGDFGIERVFPTSYVVGGRVTIEIRAQLGSMALAGIDDLKPEDKVSPVEQDPAEEVAPTLTRLPEKQDAKTSTKGGKKDKAKPRSKSKDDDLEALFGTLWPLGQEVKLDPTVERVKFREQKDWLKANGYQFKMVGQMWLKKV